MSNDGPIHHNYNVTRTDGRDAPGQKHFECDHFVLDLTHDPYALPALLAYAEACSATHPKLAAALGERVRFWEQRRSAE